MAKTQPGARPDPGADPDETAEVGERLSPHGLRRIELKKKIDEGIASLREVQRDTLERARGLVKKVSDPSFRALKG